MRQLEGSDKQVAWANDIRAAWLNEIEIIIAELEQKAVDYEAENGGTCAFYRNQQVKFRQYATDISDIKSAKWIIDHREAGHEFGKWSRSISMWAGTFKTIRESWKSIF